MMGYNVLSNEIMIAIMEGSLFLIWFLLLIFGLLGQRDAISETKKKGLFRKIIPWLVLCIFLSELSLLIYRCNNYPWDIEPQPSQASALRELQYAGSNCPIFGWANDYQQPILLSFAGCVLWLCWTIYAFSFKPSATSWWKKTLKAIAYFILSISILGFHFHEFKDLWLYLGVAIIIIILLWIAKVRPKKEIAKPIEKDEKKEESIFSAEDKGNNDEHQRFMPQSAVSMEIETKPDSSDFESNEAEAAEETSKKIVTEQINENALPQQEPITSQKEITINNTLEEELMYCKHCGKRIESDSAFCKYCGKKL